MPFALDPSWKRDKESTHPKKKSIFNFFFCPNSFLFFVCFIGFFVKIPVNQIIEISFGFRVIKDQMTHTQKIDFFILGLILKILIWISNFVQYIVQTSCCVHNEL